MKKKLFLTISIEYDRPQHQSNYMIVAEALHRHADDIVRHPDTGAKGQREYEIKTTHGTIKAVISWEMT